jgi:hypothetical protein
MNPANPDDSSPLARRRSVSACDVLPDELIAEIQRHVAGTYVYVPAVGTRGRSSRVAEVLRLRAGGVSIAETARRVGVSVRRICQIQKRECLARSVQQGGSEHEGGAVASSGSGPHTSTEALVGDPHAVGIPAGARA